MLFRSSGCCASSNLPQLTSATEHSQVYAFAADFREACRRANDLDARILSGASYISAAYGDLVSLAARQAAAGMELTVGSLESDVKMFMRGAGGVK